MGHASAAAAAAFAAVASQGLILPQLYEAVGAEPERQLVLVEWAGQVAPPAYLIFVELLLPLQAPKRAAAAARWAKRVERPHNVALALASAAMLVGIVVSMVRSGKAGVGGSGLGGDGEEGVLHGLLCRPFVEDRLLKLTCQCFFWSKFWEWVDTYLLVAKGKPVSWLHYTHHATTALLTSLNTAPITSAVWSVACSTNCFVHTWMYAYYAVPRWGPIRRTRRWITRVQILQHTSVIASLLYILAQPGILSGGNQATAVAGGAGVQGAPDGQEGVCYNLRGPIVAALAMYTMYLVFFSLFYRTAYAGAASSKGKGSGKKAL